MSLIQVIKVQVDRGLGEEVGVIASTIKKIYDETLDAYIWAFDVDLQKAVSNPNSQAIEPLIGVIIDDPSREVYTADIGTQVKLRRRQSDQRYTITGLTKFTTGDISICLVRITDDGIIIDDPILYGSEIRRLTYNELGTIAPYGQLPYGEAGKFDLNGTLIRLITPQ